MKRHLTATLVVAFALTAAVAPAAAQNVATREIAYSAVTEHAGLTLSTAVLKDGTVVEVGPEGYKEFAPGAYRLDCGTEGDAAALLQKASIPPPSPVTTITTLPVEYWYTSDLKEAWGIERVTLDAKHYVALMNARHEASGSLGRFEFVDLVPFGAVVSTDLRPALESFEIELQARGLDLHNRFRQLLTLDSSGALGRAVLGWLPAGIWPPVSVLALRPRVDGEASADGMGYLSAHEIGHNAGFLHPGDGDNESPGPAQFRQGFCDDEGHCDIMAPNSPRVPYFGSCMVSPFGEPFCKKGEANPIGFFNEFMLGPMAERMNNPPCEPFSDNWEVLGNIPNLVFIQAEINGEDVTESLTRCVLEAGLEKVCLEGALEGRQELFATLIGPRLNNHWWLQVARFTPSPIRLVLWRLENGLDKGDQLNCYTLPGTTGNGDLPGLEDRKAFKAVAE